MALPWGAFQKTMPSNPDSESVSQEGSFPPNISTFPAYFRMKAIPKQPKTEYVSTMADGTLKIRVAAVPEKGKANAEIIRFFAETLNVSKSRIEIVSGAGDAVKLVRVK
jgi:uncharacterized protein YggU (UPF0235/DUF167 family)